MDDARILSQQLDVIERWAANSDKYDLYANRENQFLTIKKGWLSILHRFWIVYVRGYGSCSDLGVLADKVSALVPDMDRLGRVNERSVHQLDRLVQNFKGKDRNWKSLAQRIEVWRKAREKEEEERAQTEWKKRAESVIPPAYTVNRPRMRKLRNLLAEQKINLEKDFLPLAHRIDLNKSPDEFRSHVEKIIEESDNEALKKIYNEIKEKVWR